MNDQQFTVLVLILLAGFGGWFAHPLLPGSGIWIIGGIISIIAIAVIWSGIKTLINWHDNSLWSIQKRRKAYRAHLREQCKDASEEAFQKYMEPFVDAVYPLPWRERELRERWLRECEEARREGRLPPHLQ
jgi:hypothetical protein